MLSDSVRQNSVCEGFAAGLCCSAAWSWSTGRAGLGGFGIISVSYSGSCLVHYAKQPNRVTGIWVVNMTAGSTLILSKDLKKCKKQTNKTTEKSEPDNVLPINFTVKQMVWMEEIMHIHRICGFVCTGLSLPAAAGWTCVHGCLGEMASAWYDQLPCWVNLSYRALPCTLTVLGAQRSYSLPVCTAEWSPTVNQM